MKTVKLTLQEINVLLRAISELAASGGLDDKTGAELDAIEAKLRETSNQERRPE